MNMPRITVAVGVVLILQGVGFYVGVSSKSVTALIPAFVGAPILILGILAFKDALRQRAMLAAGLLAVLGFLAAIGRMVSAGLNVATAAGISVLILAVLTGSFLCLSVKSFIDERRRKTSKP